MGLLDDAIREHLDLKRRHGASEDEIARKEAEALGPVRRVVRPEDEEGQDVEAAVAADPDFRSGSSFAADPENQFPSEDPYGPRDPVVDDLGWETPAAADDQTRVLRAPSEQPVEDDDFTRAEPTAADDQAYDDDLSRPQPTAAGDQSYDDERSRAEPTWSTEPPYDDDRSRLRPATSDGSFEHDAPALERPAAGEGRLARVDDETFADGEPGAVPPPPEEARASIGPEAADFAPPAYGEPYDPLDPLFAAAPEPDLAPSAGPDWVGRPAPSDAEAPPEDAQAAEHGATSEPAAYRIGPPSADEPPDGGWMHAEPSGRDNVSPPEHMDGESSRVEKPPRRAGRGGSRAAGSEDAAPDGEQADSPDMLEETPKFLQETPEHDRLWFEQRPPRDFDFDD